MGPLSRFLAALLLALVLGATPARAQTTVTMGGGLGLLLTSGSSSYEGSLGIALEAMAEHLYSENVGLRMRLDWGLTRFDRTVEAIKFGNSAVSWTANAYGDVTDWLVDGDPEYLLLRIMGSFFAYTFLTLGFVFAGMVYAVSPLLATSFVELGFSVAGHLPFGRSDVFIEGGLGALVYGDGRGPVVGMGPLIGLGYRHEKVRLGVHLLWSPPAWQVRSGSTGPHAFAGGVTLGVDV